MDRRALLISDVDGTLLGNDAELSAFARWRETFRSEIQLVYASGRFYESLVESIQTTDLPEPDAIIGGVGTEIRDYPSRRSLGDWPGDLNGWDRLRICDALSRFDELQMQEPEFLSDFKISYHVHNASDEFLGRVRDQLERAGCRVEVIYSSRRDLDVLPRGVNKGTAAEHLARLWEFTPENVVVCGDSGNDRPLFERGFCGVVVANARDELRSLSSQSTYHARRPYAAGVLEGVTHWLRIQSASL